MRYAVKCMDICGGYFEINDGGSETHPECCCYCGGTNIQYTGLKEGQKLGDEEWPSNDDTKNIENIITEVIINDIEKERVLNTYKEFGIIKTGDEGVYTDLKEMLEDENYDIYTENDHDLYCIKFR